MASSPRERHGRRHRGPHRMRCAKHKMIPCQGPLGHPGVLGEHTGEETVPQEGKHHFIGSLTLSCPFFR